MALKRRDRTGVAGEDVQILEKRPCWDGQDDAAGKRLPSLTT